MGNPLRRLPSLQNPQWASLIKSTTFQTKANQGYLQEGRESPWLTNSKWTEKNSGRSKFLSPSRGFTSHIGGKGNALLILLRLICRSSLFSRFSRISSGLKRGKSKNWCGRRIWYSKLQFKVILVTNQGERYLRTTARTSYLLWIDQKENFSQIESLKNL